MMQYDDDDDDEMFSYNIMHDSLKFLNLRWKFNKKFLFTFPAYKLWLFLISTKYDTRFRAIMKQFHWGMPYLIALSSIFFQLTTSFRLLATYKDIYASSCFL